MLFRIKSYYFFHSAHDVYNGREIPVDGLLIIQKREKIKTHEGKSVKVTQRRRNESPHQ